MVSSSTTIHHGSMTISGEVVVAAACSLGEIVITTEFTQPMYMLTTLFATSYNYTAKKVVVDTIWQLHTHIVTNSWSYTL